MATGVYVHIPFCKSRCRYCDFFSTTQHARREEYVRTLIEEWKQRQIPTTEVSTVYIGGGTPSQLSAEQIGRILRAILEEEVSRREVTMEVNPADLTPAYLKDIRKVGVNRLSMGIQTFHDELLGVIGRRHNRQEAINAIRMAQEAGFDNLSIDLIYALPSQSMEMWEEDICTALEMGVQHISTYCLSYEEGTILTTMRDRGEIKEADDELANAMYDTLCERLKKAGFEHYEVSNFALKGYRSRHNSSYWNHTPYIGLGAGAHSFDGKDRSLNPNDLNSYIEGTLAQSLQRESELLTEEEIHEEKVMLGLRTAEGVEVSILNEKQDQKVTRKIAQYLAEGLLVEKGTRVHATQKGIHILNTIISDLI